MEVKNLPAGWGDFLRYRFDPRTGTYPVFRLPPLSETELDKVRVCGFPLKMCTTRIIARFLRRKCLNPPPINIDHPALLASQETWNARWEMLKRLFLAPKLREFFYRFYHRKLYFGEQGDLPAPCPFCLEPDNFEHFALRCAAAQRDRAFTDACWQFWRPEKNLQGCWDAHFSADEQWTTFHFLLTHCRYRIRSEASINGARAEWNDVVSLFRSKLAMHLTTLFRPPHPPPGASPSAPISSEWLMEGHWATQDPPVIGPYKVEVSFPPANVLYE
jgi:hypothetical protein